MNPSSPTNEEHRSRVLAGRKVVVVEDQVLVAEFLELMCVGLGMEVQAICVTFRDALTKIREKRPDLILLDIALPDGDGLELARTVLAELPIVKILAVSARRDPWTMLQVQRSGVHGFVDKNEQRTAVVAEAMESVLMGRVYYGPVVNESSAKIRRDPKAFFRVLSDHETKVLSLIGEAKSDQEIGVIMGISPATVQSLRRDIMRKVDVHTTPKLIHYAIVNGVTRADHLG